MSDFIATESIAWIKSTFFLQATSFVLACAISKRVKNNKQRRLHCHRFNHPANICHHPAIYPQAHRLGTASQNTIRVRARVGVRAPQEVPLEFATHRVLPLNHI